MKYIKETSVAGVGVFEDTQQWEIRMNNGEYYTITNESFNDFKKALESDDRFIQIETGVIPKSNISKIVRPLYVGKNETFSRIESIKNFEQRLVLSYVMS